MAEEEKKDGKNEPVGVPVAGLCVISFDLINQLIAIVETLPARDARGVLNAVDPNLGNAIKPLETVLSEIKNLENNKKEET